MWPIHWIKVRVSALFVEFLILLQSELVSWSNYLAVNTIANAPIQIVAFFLIDSFWSKSISGSFRIKSSLFTTFYCL